MTFTIYKIPQENIENVVKSIGFDVNYLDKGILKHKFISLKILSLTPIQATIIKQTALSSGCDLATNKNVLTHSIEKSDAILSGTISQLQKVANSLKAQQFSLPDLASCIEKILTDNKKNQTKIMAILNLSENSFSNDFKEPISYAKELLDLKIDIIDIGAQSTAPMSLKVSDDEQIEKLAPVLNFLKGKVTISVDTTTSKVAEFAVKNGADIINDVSFLSDTRIANIVSENNKKLILTHSRGNSCTMDNLCNYKDVVQDIYLELKEKVEALSSLGFTKDNLIVDVGFGFAKNIEQNLELMKNIEIFKNLGYPILAGVSRKRMIQEFSNTKENDELDIITSFSSFYFAQKNIDILRVHNPYLTRLAIKFSEAL